ncbi:MAG: tRNA pseudouridine(13) synthase TruD [Chloroflexi bacterium]|nr:tRNA pseudouridine(13) synthase TruD [Chloroflexota bacterium]
MNNASKTAYAFRPDPDDFVVEEVLNLEPGLTGDHAVYRATKKLLTTPELQRLVATELGKPPRTVTFPALKDKRAVTSQHFSISGRGPTSLKGRGFDAIYVGRVTRPLGPHDLAGNRFTITLRSLTEDRIERVSAALRDAATIGLPNYFDEQRFASYTPGGPFIGKAVLQRDAEGALKAYMAHIAAGDLPPIRKFKSFVMEHWGDWNAILDQAPQSNYRSILTFLKQHPRDFRKAINLITPGLVPVLLAAYQSYLWNRMASRVLARKIRGSANKLGHIAIAGEKLSLYRTLTPESTAMLQRLTIPLPNHRMVFTDTDARNVMGEVLSEEGLTPDDMKARLMKRAYLTKNMRRVVMFPADVEVVPSASDRLVVKYTLPPGSYGTLVIKTLLARAT